jgi:hypothetical protein
MRLRLPKPLHGWRQLAGEVGIIVVGVLIALGAQQVAETVHWRSEVVQFREAEDAELANNFAALQYRVNQSPCALRRIAELQEWGNRSRLGEVKPLTGEIGRPSSIILRDAVWSAGAEELSHMPMERRLEYSTLSDLFDSIGVQMTAEKEAWRSLAAFNGATRLSDDARMRLNELLYRVKSLDYVLVRNWPPVAAEAGRLGVRPDFGRNARFIPPADPKFCQSLLRG